jgi:hypothetical protein
MRKFIGIVFAVVFMVSATESRADGWEVDNIWWNLILNYNNSGMDVCVAEQYNNQTLSVTFDIYPAPGLFPPKPPYRHQQITQVMAPYTLYRPFGWIHGPDTPVPPQCTLVSYRAEPVTVVQPEDIKESQRVPQPPQK